MDKKFTIRLFGGVFLLLGIAILGFALYRNSPKDDQPLIFADRTMLAALYDDYKQEYWEKSTGRTLDKERNSITTSEGQSYTMLRAVWQSDQQTFDKAWEWTQKHIEREDNLFAWKWGQRPDGTYGILEDEGGLNTASDADVDIAFALLMAAGRWQQEKYLVDAKEIIPSIWEHEVITINGKPYLAANNLEKGSMTDAVMNPSYFAPYAYREFAKIDKSHDWNALVDSSYEITNKSIDDNLNVQESAGLPPDWFIMDKETGEIRAASDINLTTNYSYDAIRTPWRLALDYQWHKDPRAKDTLAKMSFLSDEWSEHKKIFSTYSHDGKIIKEEESPSIYGANIGYFVVSNPDQAEEIYNKKLRTLYNPNDNAWIDGVSYYSDNWAWFGMSLYGEQLDNPAAFIKIKDQQ